MSSANSNGFTSSFKIWIIFFLHNCLTRFSSTFLKRRGDLCLDVCPILGLLDHMLLWFLTFWGTSILFSIVILPIYIPPNSVGEVPFHCTFSISLFSEFWMMAILTGVRWYFIEVLIYISIVISNAEHIFTCFLVICMSSMSSLEKCLLRSFFHFLIGMFVLWHWAL